MPIYEYLCPRCGLFATMGKMTEASVPAPCPACQSVAPRVLSVPRLAVLSRAQRIATERNEKSAHEPRQSGRHTCDAGCSHPSKVRSTQPKRPWMLGH